MMLSINNNSAPMETKQKTPEEIFRNIAKVAGNVDSKCCGSIHRVVEELRKLKESAYSPQLVSIGPLHSKDKHIQKSPVQDVKMSYVKTLLRRVKHDSIIPRSELDVLTECVDKMKQSLVHAKKWYAEQVEALDEEMLVIDGCFILELLYRSYDSNNNRPPPEDPEEMSAASSNSEPEGKPDPIIHIPQTRVTVQNDLLLLENQLPFFVLRELFDLTVRHIRPLNLSLIDYVLHFIRDIFKFVTSNVSAIPERIFWEANYYHILHILHHYSHPSEWNSGPSSEVKPCASEQKKKIMPCASELEYAGVQFFSPTNTEVNQFMVEFHKPQGRFSWLRGAQFKIPTLSLDDSTEILMRNLIAFEQTRPTLRTVRFYFTSYAFFMDKLINTSKDVEVLEKPGVIESSLGDRKEAAHLFNKLCKEVNLPPEEFYFAKWCDDAADYSHGRWAKLMADVRRKFFASPWTFIAFCTAFLYFVITVVGFVITVVDFI